MLRVLRVARLLRAVRLLRGFKGLRNIAMTLLLAFPQFLNVGFFLALVIFVYAPLSTALGHVASNASFTHGHAPLHRPKAVCQHDSL